MSKLYRSLLWSGLVVAGVAACGDDVSIVQPPDNDPTVRSISVAPNGVTVGIGANVITMSAAVNADAGVTNLAVTWSTSDAAKATVSQTGAVTTLAAGSVAIIACSQLAPAVCGNATLTIAVNVPVVNSVTVTPPNASFVVGQPPVTFVASVQGTNSPAQTVVWSTASGNANVVSVGAATGIVTVVGAGTEVVKACATAAPTVCGSSAVTVQVAAPTQISIQGITQTGTTTPVNLANVSGQVDVILNVDPGAGSLVKVQVLIDGVVAAEQCFVGTCPVTLRVETDLESAVQTVILSLNTRQVRKLANGLYIPVSFNGPRNFSAKLFTSLTTSGQSSNVIPVVLQNQDAWVAGTTPVLSAASATPSFVVGATTFFKSNVNFVGGANYISFFPVTPSIVFSSTCGLSGNAVVGTFNTGISFAGTFPCATASIEGLVSLSPIGIVTPGTAPAADVIYIAADTETTEQVGTAFVVNGNQYFNLLDGGTILAGNTVAIDTKAPVVCVQSGVLNGACLALAKVAFNDLFDQAWVNASYNFLTNDVISTDAGTGVASEAAYSHLPSAVVCSTATPVTTGADLAETSTSDGTPEGYRICATATDNLGNVSVLVGFSNFFGVDKVAPTSRLAGSTAATPLIAPFTVASVSAVANTTIYGDGVGPLSGTMPVMPATDAWGLEALDTRSGFNQNAVAGFPASQTLARLAVSGPTSCPTFTSPMGIVLSDTWVRTNVLVNTVDCLFGIGYYNYAGNVVDRAGNAATSIIRNFAQDHVAAPVLASIGASVPLYTAGAAAAFFVFGSDDLEIIEGDITPTYPNIGLVTATITGITYPLSQINGTNPGVRWDALLNNIVTAGTITVPNLLGRVDFTCTGAGAPYASCTAADGVATVAAQYNNVNTTDDGQSPNGVRAVAFDVASNGSNTVAAGLLSIQTSDVAQAWVGADLITWQVLTPTGANVVARHMASTSITAPYFDSVLLVRTNAGVTDLRVCGTFPAPALTDNGVNRFWTYTIVKPVASAQCGTGGNWYAIGIKGAAALVTQGQP